MVIRDLLRETTAALRQGGGKNAVSEAHWIVRAVLKISPMDLVLHGGEEAAPEKIKIVQEIVQKRLCHEPLQYLLGTQEFMSLEFIVTPDVLIPRADTETLVEHVLAEKLNQGFCALDVGTGSGCIALSLAHYNKRAYVRGVDISRRALAVARRNAKKLQLADRTVFEFCDIMRDNFFGRYDVIISNPPYIETSMIPTLDMEVRQFEPYTALDGGKDGLDFYRRIIKIAPKHLNINGLLAFEVGHVQAVQVAEIMAEDFTNIQIVNDLCSIPRVVSGIKKEVHSH